MKEHRQEVKRSETPAMQRKATECQRYDGLSDRHLSLKNMKAFDAAQKGIDKNVHLIPLNVRGLVIVQASPRCRSNEPSLESRRRLAISVQSKEQFSIGIILKTILSYCNRINFWRWMRRRSVTVGRNDLRKVWTKERCTLNECPKTGTDGRLLQSRFSWHIAIRGCFAHLGYWAVTLSAS